MGFGSLGLGFLLVWFGLVGGLCLFSGGWRFEMLLKKYLGVESSS